MRDVAKPLGLVRRGGTFSLRVVVPLALRSTFAEIWSRERPAKATRRKGGELAQVWLPLGTGDRSEAIARANLERVRLDGLFDEARAALALPHGKAPSPAAPTRDAIHRAVRDYFYELERKAPPVPMDAEARAKALEVAIQEAGAAEATNATDGMVQRVAMSVAKTHGLDISSDPSLSFELFSSVLEAEREYFTRQTQRLALEVVQQRHGLFADIGPNRPPAKTMTLKQAVEAYKAAPERSGRSPKTKAAWAFRLAAWLDLLGPDIAVASIMRQQVNDARDTLMAVPANAAKRWPEKPLVEVAALARKTGIAPMSRKSVKLYVEAFASMMKWLAAEEKITANPARNIGLPDKPVGEEPPRRPMTVPELTRLFHAGPYATPAAARGWRFWLPSLGLFHGLRIAEILGLRAGDIRQQDGVWVIDIASHPGRTLKTQQSARLVPLHPAVEQLGFLAFASGQPTGGMLFGDLPGRADDRLNASQKAMGRFIRSVFPGDRRLTFHSLRHTWVDAARNAYVPEPILERLGGWKRPGASAMHGYGAGFEPAVLAAELRKVVFVGLDLSHLRPPQ